MVTLNQYLNNITLNEDAAGTTSGAIGPVATSPHTPGAPTVSTDLTYIPGTFKVKQALTKQSLRKRPLILKTTKGPKQHRIKIGESLFINVMNEHWNSFKKEIFNNAEPITGNLIDLSAYLTESLNDEVNIAMNILRDRFTALLNEPQFVNQRKKISSLIQASNDSHVSFGKPDKTLISEPSTTQQINYLLAIVNKAYKNNLGEIEILTHYITNRLPLESIVLFRNLDNLSGNIIQGTFLGQSFIFYSVIDLNYQLNEYLQFDNNDLLNRFKTHPGFKVEGNKVYPGNENGFETNIAEVIKKYIEGAN